MKLLKYIISICITTLLAAMPQAAAQYGRVNVKVPGTLSEDIYRLGIIDASELTVSGMIEDRDFQVLRRMLYLSYLDLTQTNIRSLPANSLSHMRNLTTLLVPSNITRIGRSALEGCLKIHQFTISDRVTEIAPAAFASCRALQVIDIPPSVKKIGEEAFMGCSSLAEVVINGTPTIGKRAFAGCMGIQIVVCTSLDPPDIDLSVFEGTAPQKQLGVPYLSIEAYKTHPVWGKLFTHILPATEK